MLTIQYRYPLKIGDAAVDIEDVLPSCSGSSGGESPPGDDDSPVFYVATADWNAAEGDPGHIKNRTHFQLGDYIKKLDNKFLDIEPLTTDEIDSIWNEVMT